MHYRMQISAYERGHNIPSTEVLMKIADIFDVSLDYLASEALGKTGQGEYQGQRTFKAA